MGQSLKVPVVSEMAKSTMARVHMSSGVSFTAYMDEETFDRIREEEALGQPGMMDIPGQPHALINTAEVEMIVRGENIRPVQSDING